MTNNYDVRLWKTEVYEGKRSTTHYVRWGVAKQPFKKPFETAAAADSYRSDLKSARNAGEPFDIATGEPTSWARESVKKTTCFDFFRAYVGDRWHEVSAKHRENMAEVMMWATIATLQKKSRFHDDKLQRKALRSFAFNVKKQDHAPADIEQALVWVARNSRPVSDLENDPALVSDVTARLFTTIGGHTRSAWSRKRHRAVIKTAIDRAVEQQYLTKNPFTSKELKVKKVKSSIAIDKRRVLNADQAKRLFETLPMVKHSGPRLVGFFATMYYTGLRPEEAVDLKLADLEFPTTEGGWGELHVSTAAPDVGGEWTDSGLPRDTRCLKQREPGDVRHVPMPPQLVTILRQHLSDFDRGPDHRIFSSYTGDILPAVTCRRTFATARLRAFTETEQASPIAQRIYDLRHARLSRWLNAGVPPTQVAEWAGNSVAILLSIYAKCIDGEDAIYKARIEAAES